jgi:hypothetical protein
MNLNNLDARLWAALKPIGYTRYDSRYAAGNVQFYAPGAESGYIEVGGLIDISFSARTADAPAFAAGLRALAEVLESPPCPHCHDTGTILVWEQRDEYNRHITIPGDSGERDDPDWQESCDCAVGETT